MLEHQALLEKVKSHVESYFMQNFQEEYHFHNYQHILNVVDSCHEIADSYQLSDEDFLSLLLAAWFHDIGYSESPEDHENRSAEHAAEFLNKEGLDAELIEKVGQAILATKMPQRPHTLIEKILCDADLSHLGKKNYWNRCGKLRYEMAELQGRIMGDEEWLDFEIQFLNNHDYFTKIASALYSRRKRKNIARLLKQKKRVMRSMTEVDQTDIAKTDQKASSKKNDPLRELSLGRGVETMYRNSYRTHINLSAIADNKANIMLSVNAIILSIVVSSLVPRLVTDKLFLLPTLSLLLTCLLAIIYATLSTKPKVTEGFVSKNDILQRKSNLLFFGNFYKMELSDFHWGMMEMIKDQDFLYSSMTRDLYFLGKVLAKKYRYLSICYTIFMTGLILSVLLFGLSLYLYK